MTSNEKALLGYSQYHLAVAGGYAVGTNRKSCACTHPLPLRGRSRELRAAPEALRLKNVDVRKRVDAVTVHYYDLIFDFVFRALSIDFFGGNLCEQP
jgi:hypothetical protein